MKVPKHRLCVIAGVAPRTYDYAVAGETRPVQSTVAKLNLALDRFRTGFGKEAGELAPHATFKACLIIASFYKDADARTVLASIPGRKATADPEWLDAARTRQLAYWICNGFFGMREADIGRAAGVTKQAVSNAIAAIMDGRDTDPELDRICRQIERVFE